MDKFLSSTSHPPTKVEPTNTGSLISFYKNVEIAITNPSYSLEREFSVESRALVVLSQSIANTRVFFMLTFETLVLYSKF